uniref:Uncharacterized protein n=1 Tax=Arundo donax TaxID=35708 RepID=A0A0A9G6F4_ARUDO
MWIQRLIWVVSAGKPPTL